MIERISELDQYTLSDFRKDYIDPEHERFRKDPDGNNGFFENLSVTLLFEVSKGRKIDAYGRLIEENEVPSYYYSMKCGGDVIGNLGFYTTMNNFTYMSVIEFGEPGPAQECPPNGDHTHSRYPTIHNTSCIFYSYAGFHAPVVMHNTLDLHDNLSVDGDAYFEGDTYFKKDIHGCCLSARWADLAENYVADADYPPGTLLMFGGSEEVTAAVGTANAVVTEQPGVVLNSNQAGAHVVGIALMGRTRVRVTGEVSKFDRLCISTTPGVARRRGKFEDVPAIGVALEDSPGPGEGLVMSSVRLSLD